MAHYAKESHADPLTDFDPTNHRKIWTSLPEYGQEPYHFQGDEQIREYQYDFHHTLADALRETLAVQPAEVQSPNFLENPMVYLNSNTPISTPPRELPLTWPLADDK